MLLFVNHKVVTMKLFCSTGVLVTVCHVIGGVKL